MAHLIIGSVTRDTACIWVRGEKKNLRAILRHRPADASEPWQTESALLEAHRGFTAVINLSGLRPATAYECRVSYAKGDPPPVAAGAFRTAPAGTADLCFIVGSCNYSKLALFTAKNVDAAWTRIGGLVEATGAGFMIHCGDQIYSDLPGTPVPDLSYFQREYQSAWKRGPTARVLAALPHYMMLDDHEIFDGFANDREFVGQPAEHVRDVALEAYRQYQHSHNPPSFPTPALYYKFEFAGVHFFALDARSERWSRSDPQMISVAQMNEFKLWLGQHAAEPKFVVSSIPFVGEARKRDDKWCADVFLAQREEIIDFLAARGISRLCFLTGDMHCSYHATMTVTPTAGAPLTVHELMASPINQAATGMHQFVDRPARRTPGGATYQTAPLDAAEFYGSHSNVTVVRCAPAGGVEWAVYRTKGTETPPVPVVAGRFPF